MWVLAQEVRGKVTFQFYRDGSLYYKTEGGFTFKVPISDTGTGTFFPQDKGVFFMRWLRPQLQEANAELSGETHEPPTEIVLAP